MGGEWAPNGWERLGLQVASLVLVAIWPLALLLTLLSTVVIIPHAYRWRPTFENKLRAIWRWFWLVIVAPPVVTWDNCRFIALEIWDRVARSWDPSRPPLRHTPLIAGPELYRGDHSQGFENVDDTSLLASQQPAYRPYPIQGLHGFRLLAILPGSFDEPLRGTILSTSFLDHSRPKYDALSYTWADESCDATLSHRMLVEEDVGPDSEIPITRNCDNAVRQLRWADRVRHVWVDAICIDQHVIQERTHQVSLMSQIYTSARTVVVYTGQATPETDDLFDWLNEIDLVKIRVPERFSSLRRMESIATELERHWNYCRKGMTRALGNQPAIAIDKQMSQEDIIDIAIGFFSRRWFHRVWVLQEVALPNPRAVTVMCGSKSITATRALHFLSLLREHPAAGMMRIFFIIRHSNRSTEKSHLLDVLIETRAAEAADPRDKIFGVLSIADMLDSRDFHGPKADYSKSAREVYVQTSMFFILHHGPGLFLALIKPPKPGTSDHNVEGLPSWAVDWTTSWLNQKAVGVRDFATASRSVGSGVEGGPDFVSEVGLVGAKLVLFRPRILRGWFSRSGHVDGSCGVDSKPQNVEELPGDLVLIELYPRLAALLQVQADDEYSFLQSCPHGLCESSVYDAMNSWSDVVLDAKGWNDVEASDSAGYLGPRQEFEII